MNIFKYRINRIIVVILIFIMQLVIFSCNKVIESNSSHDSNVISEKEVSVKIDYNYYNVFGISPAKIIVPKNQTSAQGLSVLVNDGHGNLIVFDGGRSEDADFLCDVIKDNGGVVKTWFLTHIHDDHIGALYKILKDKRTDIEIQQIYYDFASFDWYYKKMGNDAGIYTLFNNCLVEYNKYLENINKKDITICEIGFGDFSYYYYPKDKSYNIETNEYLDIPSSHMSVNVLNKHYELDQDPINNTSIVYAVDLFGDRGADYHCNILILGDLGYEGGIKLLNENFQYFDNMDIVVLSHHGQNGIAPELYKKFNPKVVVWPTSKDIYENTHGTYHTDYTKKVLREISSIEYQIKSYEETAVIR